MLPHSCSCSVAPWGHCWLLASLRTGQNCRMCSGDCGPVLQVLSSYEPALAATCVGAGSSVQSSDGRWRFVVAAAQGGGLGPTGFLGLGGTSV